MEEHDEMEHGDKYVAFKAEDFFRALRARDLDGEAIIRALAPHMLDDAVIIRRQDRFAAGAFDTYADQILALVELSEDHPLIDLLPPSTKTSLLRLADFFRDQAHLSRTESSRKLPN